MCESVPDESAATAIATRLLDAVARRSNSTRTGSAHSNDRHRNERQRLRAPRDDRRRRGRAAPRERTGWKRAAVLQRRTSRARGVGVGGRRGVAPCSGSWRVAPSLSAEDLARQRSHRRCRGVAALAASTRRTDSARRIHSRSGAQRGRCSHRGVGLEGSIPAGRRLVSRTPRHRSRLPSTFPLGSSEQAWRGSFAQRSTRPGSAPPPCAWR